MPFELFSELRLIPPSQDGPVVQVEVHVAGRVGFVFEGNHPAG